MPTQPQLTAQQQQAGLCKQEFYAINKNCFLYVYTLYIYIWMNPFFRYLIEFVSFVHLGYKHLYNIVAVFF